MEQKISLQELVAINNMGGARALVVKYGYEPARDFQDLLYKLTRLTKEHGKKALKDLADIHPHKDLIMYFNKSEDKSHADGCMYPACRRKRMMSGYSNFDYADEYLDFIGKKNETKNGAMASFNEYLPLIAVAGIFALAITSMNK